MGWVIGVDEVGRGPLAGPVMTAGVMVERKMLNPYPVNGVRDSKKLSAKNRTILAGQLLGCDRIRTCRESASPNRIDTEGIVPVLGKCFRDTIRRLLGAALEKGETVDLVLVDGEPLWTPNYLTGSSDVPVRFIVGGDDKEWSIGAASIIAKVLRDAEMTRLAAVHPGYGWERNAGYGTPEHIKAIRTKGLTPQHRVTFCKHFVPSVDTSVMDLFGSPE